MDNDKENVPTKKLTIETLKQFKGFENVNEDEANQVIQTLEIFASITFELFKQLKSNKNGKHRLFGTL